MTTNDQKRESGQLRARWAREDVEALNKSLRSAFIADSPFGSADGLVDFRGFPLSVSLDAEVVAMAQRRPVPLDSVPALAGVDFSFASSVGIGQFSNAVVEGCHFLASKIGPNWSRKFLSCSFALAAMEGSLLSGVFEDCKFSASKLLRSRCVRRTRFVRCSFAEADMKVVQWIDSFFEDCDFEGTRLSGSTFAGSTFTRTRLSSLQERQTVLSRCRFEE